MKQTDKKKSNGFAVQEAKGLRPHVKDTDNWLERALNSPKLFYGLTGVLCSCYVTFAVLDHLASKNKGDEAGSQGVALSMPFKKKPAPAKPYTSEYGGLFYVRGEDAEKKEAEETSETDAPAQTPAKDAPEDVPQMPDFSDLMPEGTVVYPAEEPDLPAGSEGFAFKPSAGLGGSSGGGSSSGAGASLEPLRNINETPQLASMGPASALPPGGGASPLRRMINVDAGSGGGPRGMTSASGVRGAGTLPEGGATPTRFSNTGTLTETTESSITGAGTSASGVEGAGAERQSGVKTAKSPSANKSSGGGGGGGSNAGSSNSSGQGTGTCSRTTLIQTKDGGYATVCVGESNADSGSYGQFIRAVDAEQIEAQLGDTGEGNAAEPEEYFKEKTFLDRLADMGEGVSDFVRKSVGGVRSWWQDEVVPNSPTLKAVDDAFHATVRWIDKGINTILGRPTLRQENKILENFFDWVSDSKDNFGVGAKPKLEFSMDDVYRLRNRVDTATYGVHNEKMAQQIRQKIEREFVNEKFGGYWDELQKWYENKKKNLDTSDWDYPDRMLELQEGWARDRAEFQQLKTTKIMTELHEKLYYDSNGLNDSRLQEEFRRSGMKPCGLDKHPVRDPRTGAFECVYNNPDPFSRTWTWIGRLFVDGVDGMKNIVKETNEVNENGVVSGTGVLATVAKMIYSPFAALGDWIIGKPDNSKTNQQFPDTKTCPAGTRRDLNTNGCVNVATHQFVQAVVPGPIGEVEAPRAKPAPKKESGGFFGWLSDIGTGIKDFFSGESQKSARKNPVCGAGMRVSDVGGDLVCTKDYRETGPDVLTSADSESAPAGELPVILKSDQPLCGSGYTAEKHNGSWDCVTVQKQVKKDVAARLGTTNGETYIVQECPEGTRRVVTDQGEPKCIFVHAVNAGIFVQSGDSRRPWIELNKCPPQMDTIITNQPNPGDMSCRTPTRPRPADQNRKRGSPK